MQTMVDRIDPGLLFKMLFVGYLFGIRSERRLEKEIQVNTAYRWFLGLGLTGKVPDHSTISRNRIDRFEGTGVYQEIFDKIVLQAVDRWQDALHGHRYARFRGIAKVQEQCLMSACAQNMKKIALILAREGTNGSKTHLDRFRELLSAHLIYFFKIITPKKNLIFGRAAVIY